MEKFTEQEKSCFHLEALNKIGVHQSMLCCQIRWQNKNTDRMVLELAFGSINFLVHEGIPLRGQCHHDGVLWQFMLERTCSLPAVRKWLLRRVGHSAILWKNYKVTVSMVPVTCPVASLGYKCDLRRFAQVHYFYTAATMLWIWHRLCILEQMYSTLCRASTHSSPVFFGGMKMSCATFLGCAQQGGV